MKATAAKVAATAASVTRRPRRAATASISGHRSTGGVGGGASATGGGAAGTESRSAPPRASPRSSRATSAANAGSLRNAVATRFKPSISLRSAAAFASATASRCRTAFHSAAPGLNDATANRAPARISTGQKAASRDLGSAMSDFGCDGTPTSRFYLRHPTSPIPHPQPHLRQIVPPYSAFSPSISSMRNSWLYLAMRSVRLALPVLIWPVFKATARSAMVVSSDSPLRWLITAV